MYIHIKTCNKSRFALKHNPWTFRSKQWCCWTFKPSVAWRYNVRVSYQRNLHWSNLSLWLLNHKHCAHTCTSYRAVFIVHIRLSFLKMQKACFCITICDPIQTLLSELVCLQTNHSMCDPIQTFIMCVAPFQLLLSPRVLPYSNFCYHHVCYSIQTCYHPVCHPIQTSVITVCVTLLKLPLSPCVLPYSNLLSPRVSPYSNFCYHHVCYTLQLLTRLHFSIISEEINWVLFYSLKAKAYLKYI